MIITINKRTHAAPPVKMLFYQPPGFACTLLMLRKNGYPHNCSLLGNHIYCSDKHLLLHPHEFVINGMFYFPPDNTVLYERMIYTIEAVNLPFRATLLLDGKVYSSVFSEMINTKLQESVFMKRKILDHGIL